MLKKTKFNNRLPARQKSYFSEQGNEMVQSLIKVAPVICSTFDQIISKEIQA
jgi:hypothetical protein